MATTLAAILLLGISLLHVYWAFGGVTKIGVAIPTKESGEPLFVPGKWATLFIALVLGALAAALFTNRARWFCLAFAVVFIARAFGDLNYVGFFKRKRGSHFARWDTWLFSPVSLLLGILILAGTL